MAGEPEFERPLVELRREIALLRQQRETTDTTVSKRLGELEGQLDQTTGEIFAGLTPWQTVQLARHPQRPRFLDYLNVLFTDFVELHGDRRFGDDPALIGGLARFEGQSVVVLGQQKGRNTRENVARNFGMPHPEGYRKALRLMRLAEKFRLPVLTFVDTSGASPGLGDEERGQAWSIAENLYSMAELRVPILATIIGEGGSGGALGIALGDRVIMLRYAVYAVAAPEFCASITWKDAAFAPDAAAAMRVTAPSLHELAIIDRIVPEPHGGAHQDPARAATLLGEALRAELSDLCTLAHDADRLVQLRYQRYRPMGRSEEART